MSEQQRKKWRRRVDVAIERNEPLYVNLDDYDELTDYAMSREPAPLPRPGEWVTPYDTFGGIEVVIDAEKALEQQMHFPRDFAR